MNYASLNDTIIDKVMKAVALINNPEVQPSIRQLNQEILFREVGSALYNKIYDMNAFDFEISYTKGPGIDDRYYGLAKVASGSVSTGDLGLREYVKNYLDNMAGKAQFDAFTNAAESRKFPRVIRTTVGKTCSWCRSLAGTYIDPPSEAFVRHRDCDCRIVTEGFNSRNGLLDNYVKPKDR